MLSRNRSTCGVRPYIRASANPDPVSWLRSFMDWWIDPRTGLAIPERSGVLRWFVMRGNEPDWADTPQELVARFGGEELVAEFDALAVSSRGPALLARHRGDRARAFVSFLEDRQADVVPMSFTFVRSSVYDNPILLKADPSYLSKLKALPYVDQQRLLYGNWNQRETAGSFFRRSWFEVVEAAPPLLEEVRYWDRAGTATKPGQEHKASWTAGCRMGRDARGVVYIRHMARFQGTALEVRREIRNTATQDGVAVEVWLEEDPGQAGKAEVRDVAREMPGFAVFINRVREAKGIRAKTLSSHAQAGSVKLVRGAWNDPFLDEAENFDGTDRCVSDQVDSASGGYHALTSLTRAGVWGK